MPEHVAASATDECPHHWMIETPNGESSVGLCKRCGATKAFLNYSQRKILTRSVKPTPHAITLSAQSNAGSVSQRV